MPTPKTTRRTAPATSPEPKPKKPATTRLTGKAYVSGGVAGKIYDAARYVQSRFEQKPTGKVRVFHQAADNWNATPGEKTWVSTKHSGGMYGKGFYTARKPERTFGPHQFQLEIPVSAFKGKKIVELDSDTMAPWDRFHMPDGVDILAVKGGYGVTGQVWLVFKPGSDEWLNKSATQADFDKPGQTDTWD